MFPCSTPMPAEERSLAHATPLPPCAGRFTRELSCELLEEFRGLSRLAATATSRTLLLATRKKPDNGQRDHASGPLYPIGEQIRDVKRQAGKCSGEHGRCPDGHEREDFKLRRAIEQCWAHPSAINENRNWRRSIRTIQGNFQIMNRTNGAFFRRSLFDRSFFACGDLKNFYAPGRANYQGIKTTTIIAVERDGLRGRNQGLQDDRKQRHPHRPIAQFFPENLHSPQPSGPADLSL